METKADTSAPRISRAKTKDEILQRVRALTKQTPEGWERWTFQESLEFKEHCRVMNPASPLGRVQQSARAIAIAYARDPLEIVGEIAA